MARKPLAPISDQSWDEEKARHLLNRAGFGIPRSRVLQLAALSPSAAVQSLVHYETAPTLDPTPQFLGSQRTVSQQYAEARKLPEDERRKRTQDIRKEERQRVERLKAWWLERMIATPRPLEEKMTLFWHGHFATSAQKVRSSHANFALNDIFRRNATGDVKRLTMRVGQSPAMLIYLDNRQNKKGKPNENWARELMELFTMGQGNYSEHDIKESARAFTGWTFDQGGFDYREGAHDGGPKTFLGRSGNFDGYDIIDRIFQQPATAEFLSRKLWSFFAYENPDDALVRELAEVMRENNYELKPLLERIFLSKAFYSKEALGNQIKSPVQFMAQLTEDLGLETPPFANMAKMCAQLGQDLFYPPNVKGWDGGAAWINANSLLLRYNMPRNLIIASAVTQREEGGMMMQQGRAASGRNSLNRRMQALIEEQPTEKRWEIRKSLRDAKDPRKRQAIMRRLIAQEALGEAWDPASLLAETRFPDGDACIDALAQRFLVKDLTKDQRAVLNETLDTTQRPVDLKSIPQESINAVLHLLLSTAEYQLC